MTVALSTSSMLCEPRVEGRQLPKYLVAYVWAYTREECLTLILIGVLLNIVLGNKKWNEDQMHSLLHLQMSIKAIRSSWWLFCTQLYWKEVHLIRSDITHDCNGHVFGAIVLLEEVLNLPPPKIFNVSFKANDRSPIVIAMGSALELLQKFAQRRIFYASSTLFQDHSLLRIKLPENWIL